MFCDRLRATRIARGFTLQNVCDSINLPMRTSQRYEGGETQPSLDTIVNLSDLLNVPVDFLLERDRFLESLGIKVDIALTSPPRRNNGYTKP